MYQHLTALIKLRRNISIITVYSSLPRYHFPNDHFIIQLSKILKILTDYFENGRKHLIKERHWFDLSGTAAQKVKHRKIVKKKCDK